MARLKGVEINNTARSCAASVFHLASVFRPSYYISQRAAHT